jgi:hypothetical protein
LSLLFFMWLFAFSGLLLNHPTWSFVESWNNRKERNYEREITTAPGPEFSTNNLEGRTPYSGLIQGSDGTLYGTTYGGVNYDGSGRLYGTVFKLLTNGSGFTIPKPPQPRLM